MTVILPGDITSNGKCASWLRYVMRHGMKVQTVTPYPFSQLQRYGVTLRGNVTVRPHIYSLKNCSHSWL
jgi:hypothetical protein